MIVLIQVNSILIPVNELIDDLIHGNNIEPAMADYILVAYIHMCRCIFILCIHSYVCLCICACMSVYSSVCLYMHLCFCMYI